MPSLPLAPATRQERISAVLASVLLLLVAAALYGAVLHANHGVFIYTLDDPYIHLALAEHLLHGHYGVNAGEFAAPSSSILWPFLLAPLSAFTLAPLLLNLLLMVLTIFALARVLSLIWGGAGFGVMLRSGLLVLLGLATNLLGLAFTGLEHGLQVLLVVLIFLGLVLEVEQRRLPSWLLVCIVLAPLVRYENIAISGGALLHLMAARRYRPAILTGLVLVLALAGFSLFLRHLGLDLMPSSIAAKSRLVSETGRLHTLLAHAWSGLFERQGVQLVLGGVLVAAHLLFPDATGRWRVALATAFALLVHLLGGEYGWFHRYEIYIVMWMLLTVCYLLSPRVRPCLQDARAAWSGVRLLLLAAMVTVIVGAEYLRDLAKIPGAAHNIYVQQYQMHRFVAEFHARPVAVNDLGLVSYGNREYVLDLYGLGSHDALKQRLHATDPMWMQRLARQHAVDLAMIYGEVFSGLPGQWIRLGGLHSSAEQITAFRQTVDFYALRPEACADLAGRLARFARTLPAQAEFVPDPAGCPAPG